MRGSVASERSIFTILPYPQTRPMLPANHTLPYDDPVNLFRIYQPEECDGDDYSFVWDAISTYVRKEADYECSQCGKAYLSWEHRRRHLRGMHPAKSAWSESRAQP